MTCPTNITLPTVHPTPHDVAATYQQVECSDASLIQQFPEERAAPLRILNSLQSKTRNLPPKILSNIFRYAFPPWDIKPHVELEEDVRAYPNPHLSKTEYQLDTPLVLGAVSSHWRQVAWSTPRLWASLVIRVLPESVNNTVALLQVHAQNSASLGLHIQVICRVLSKIDPISLAEDIQPFADSLFSSALTCRITTLVLYNAPDLWSPHLSMGLPMLETLVYVRVIPKALPEPEPSDIVLANMPSLRQLSLRGISGEIALVCDTVQTLTLQDLPIDVMVGLVFQCPSLLSFCGYEPQNAYDALSNAWLLPRNFILKHLESLEWLCLYLNGWKKLFRQLRLPSLKYLHLMYSIPISDPDIMNFFTRLPRSLSTLRISSCWGHQEILAVLRSCPQLQEFILFDSHCGAISPLLDALASTHSDEGRSIKGAKLLPNLRVLSVEELNCNMTLDFPLYVSDKILEIMEQRSHDLVGCLRLELPSGVVVWDARVIERLQEMVKDGHTVQILEDNRLVDWLC